MPKLSWTRHTGYFVQEKRNGEWRTTQPTSSAGDAEYWGGFPTEAIAKSTIEDIRAYYTKINEKPLPMRVVARRSRPS
jgi:hypothetical protein